MSLYFGSETLRPGVATGIFRPPINRNQYDRGDRICLCQLEVEAKYVLEIFLKTLSSIDAKHGKVAMKCCVSQNYSILYIVVNTSLFDMSCLKHKFVVDSLCV